MYYVGKGKEKKRERKEDMSPVSLIGFHSPPGMLTPPGLGQLWGK